MLKRLLSRIFNLDGNLRGDMMSIPNYLGVALIPVAGAVTVYTQAFPMLQNADNIGLFLKLAGTTPNITIVPQEAPQAPAAANINGADSYYINPPGVPAVCTNYQSTTPLIQPLNLVPMKWLRFEITGNAGNSSDVTVDLRLFMQEMVI